MKCDNAKGLGKKIDVMACRWFGGKPLVGGRIFLGMQMPGKSMSAYLNPAQARRLAADLMKLADERSRQMSASTKEKPPATHGNDDMDMGED